MLREENKINFGDERWAVKIWRNGHSAYKKYANKRTIWSRLNYIIYKLLNHLFVKYLLGANIPLSTQIGGVETGTC